MDLFLKIQNKQPVNDVLFVGQCQNERCIIPNNDQNPRITDSDYVSSLPPFYLWKCSKERTEVLPIFQVCDFKFDCLKSEDESSNICKYMSFSVAFFWSVAAVFGISGIMVCLRSVMKSSLLCKKCILIHRSFPCPM